jgi:hypothetical protein
MSYRAFAILTVAALVSLAGEPAPAQRVVECRELGCWRQLYASECGGAAASLETCLVFLQRLETARRREAFSADMALLLGETLHSVSRREIPTAAKERYLERTRAAFTEVVRREPLRATGYLGLADVAEKGEERIEWLRGAVQAEFRPAHMEMLANALSGRIGGQEADLEAARFFEDAYTYESTSTEKWRYGATAWQKYAVAVGLYPTAGSDRALQNVALRVQDDIDYALLQRALLEPESYLAHLADAFATMCEQSIAAIVTLDECLAGLELAVVKAEGPVSAGSRRLLAEAALAGMRTIAGEALPSSLIMQKRFRDWLDRLLLTSLEPVEVAANVLEARADYTAMLLDRADVLLAAIELMPNRGDLRLKLGATYVSLRVWPEALEQLRVARFFLPVEEHERVDRLAETADKAYQARFEPQGLPQ